MGFWGGVLLLGAVFMVALMAQKYCCDTGQRKDDIDWVFLIKKIKK